MEKGKPNKITFITNITLQDGSTELQWFQYINNRFIKVQRSPMKIYQVVRIYAGGTIRTMKYYASSQKALDSVQYLTEQNKIKDCSYTMFEIEVEA